MAAARSPARRGFLRVRRELTARLAASRWQHEGGSERGQPYCCWRMQALAVELCPGFSWFLGTKKKGGWMEQLLGLCVCEAQQARTVTTGPERSSWTWELLAAPRCWPQSPVSSQCKGFVPTGDSLGAVFWSSWPVSMCQRGVRALQHRRVQPAELRGCPHLTCIFSAPHAPLLGNLLGVSHFSKRVNSPGFGKCVGLKNSWSKGRRAGWGRGDQSSSPLWKKQTLSGVPEGSRHPATTMHALAAGASMVMSPGGVCPVRWVTGTPSSTARVTVCPSSSCAHLGPCPVPPMASHQSCSHGATEQERSHGCATLPYRATKLKSLVVALLVAARHPRQTSGHFSLPLPLPRPPQMEVRLGAEARRAATHLFWALFSFSSILRWHWQVEALL